MFNPIKFSESFRKGLLTSEIKTIDRDTKLWLTYVRNSYKKNLTSTYISVEGYEDLALAVSMIEVLAGKGRTPTQGTIEHVLEIDDRFSDFRSEITEYYTH